jgi:hypothetical protein
MELQSTVEALRRWVAEAPGRGAILEEDREPPAYARARGWLPDAIFRRWASATPGVAIHPNFHAQLPASFVALIQAYGSLHWAAPPEYDGDLAHSIRNSGPDAFLALGWPGHFELVDFLGAMDEELVARLEDASEGFHVFHDGYIEGAAFDVRVRDAAGELLVVEGFDDVTWIDRVLNPRFAEARLTFEAWLEQRIARVMAELG